MKKHDLLNTLDDVFLGGQVKLEKNLVRLEVAMKQQAIEVLKYRQLKNEAFDEMMEFEFGSLENEVRFKMFEQYQELEETHTKNLRTLIVARYKSIGDQKAVENYQKGIYDLMTESAILLNAGATVATLIPSGGSSAGFFSVGGKLPIGMSVKEASGGLNQWIRIGESWSVSGGFKTFSIRWGAGGNHWKKLVDLRFEV